MTLPGSSQCKIWFWVVWQLVLIASCYTYCCSEPSLHSHLTQKIKYVLKEMFGDNAMTKHHLLPLFGATWRTNEAKFFLSPKMAFASFGTFASSLWAWWCPRRGFPRSRRCHRSPDSAARTGWRSLANPNWCPKTGLSLWKRHYEKASSLVHVSRR